MEKLTTFSILIHFLISITIGQKVRDLFYQKPGWSNSPEKPQDCTFPCYDMSKKMLNFDIIVSLDEDCPKLEGNMEIKPFQKMSPCSNEEVKLSLICLRTYFFCYLFGFFNRGDIVEYHGTTTDIKSLLGSLAKPLCYCYSYFLRGHSTTTWTKFCHFLTPPPLPAWTVFIP